MIKKGIAIGLCIFVNNAFAGACLLESTQKNFPNKSCMQNAGTPAPIFNNFCDGSADEDHTLTKMERCPAKSLATCEYDLNGVNGKFIQHVYTEALLPLYKMTCNSNAIGKGKWKMN